MRSGGATEGYSPDAIRKRYAGPVTGIVGPFYDDWKRPPPRSGRITRVTGT